MLDNNDNNTGTKLVDQYSAGQDIEGKGEEQLELKDDLVQCYSENDCDSWTDDDGKAKFANF